MTKLGLLGLAVLTCCSPAHRSNEGKNATAAVAPPIESGASPSRSNEVANASLPDDREPLSEPKGPIDPKSAEAAGQVVQHYGALIEQHRSEEAEKLWGDPRLAAQMTSKLAPYPDIHLEVGKPAEPEGAAGSIYVTVPIIFYGKDQSGAPLRVSADTILRRVNDVPGSTPAQRRWHIERIDWKKGS